MSYINPEIFALLTLMLAIWTALYKRHIKPPNHVSTKQPVLLFEFARSAQDIRALFINQSGQPTIPFIKKMRFLVRLDYAFIGSYTMFIVFFALEVEKEHSSIVNYIAIAAAIVVGLFDILENIQLLTILDLVQQTPHSTFRPQLRRLSVFTWIKWEATVFLMLLFTPFLWSENFASRVLVILSFIVLLLGILALRERLLSRLLVWAQRFPLSVLLTFFYFLMYILVIRHLIG